MCAVDMHRLIAIVVWTAISESVAIICIFASMMILSPRSVWLICQSAVAIVVVVLLLVVVLVVLCRVIVVAAAVAVAAAAAAAASSNDDDEVLVHSDHDVDNGTGGDGQTVFAPFVLNICFCPGLAVCFLLLLLRL